MTRGLVRERRLQGFAAYDALEALPMPASRVVHGAAIGSGVEIAAACDFIVATPDATFRTPEALRGTVGATQRLPRVLGKRLAKDLMFTGRALTAEEAQGRRVRDPHRRDGPRRGRCTNRRGDPAKRRRLALKLAKRSIDRGIELDPQGALAAELEAIEEQLAAGQWMGKT